MGNFKIQKRPSQDLPIEVWTKLKDISEKLNSKISILNNRLDSQLQASLAIGTNKQVTPAKHLNGDMLERNNNFKAGINAKTIKKQQNITNYHSHSPLITNHHSQSPMKETIITMPCFISPNIKNKIIENENQIFIKNNIVDILENSSPTFQQHTDTYFKSSKTNIDRVSEKLNGFYQNKNDSELIRKINSINNILGIDLKEHINKFYNLTMQAQEKKLKYAQEKKEEKIYSLENKNIKEKEKSQEDKKIIPEKKKDEKKVTQGTRFEKNKENNGPLINVIQAPTLPIEDFLDETEIAIKNIKKDVNEELNILYKNILSQVK